MSCAEPAKSITVIDEVTLADIDTPEELALVCLGHPPPP
jgi:hypothetical protein